MKILMSVDRANKSQSMNAANRALFEKFLGKQGYDWEKVIGCYKEQGQDKPQREQSYLISSVDDVDFMVLVEMAQLFEQDCIMVIDHGECKLYEKGCRESDNYIGQWTETTESEAKANGHYTETKDGYFIAR